MVTRMLLSLTVTYIILTRRKGKWSSAGITLIPRTDHLVRSHYTNGMLLAFFAQTTNAAGQHVFGNY